MNQALQLQDAQLPGGPQPADLGTWSGAVVAVLPLERGEIRLLLGGEAVAALLPRRPKRPAMPSTPVVPLATAIGSHKLALAAHLSPFDLDLGSLSMLRVGDVIPLPHPLDAPLWVKTADATVCCAFLGQRHGRKAIELVKA
ncbi:MAG TPA: FliM/FliN family flagellar motor switch protein [Ramlibacter sp.]|nr:FliM/FliN family flagellar motor switch protein [Ramlibacter sp.]